jgi:hypothetical protein
VSDTHDREQKGEEGGIHAVAGICAAVGRRAAKSRDARTLGSDRELQTFRVGVRVFCRVGKPQGHFYLSVQQPFLFYFFGHLI